MSDALYEAFRRPEILKREWERKQKRCFLFDKSFISCNNCQSNYCVSDSEENYCQEFGISIDMYQTDKNNERALSCHYWFPNNISLSIASIIKTIKEV